MVIISTLYLPTRSFYNTLDINNPKPVPFKLGKQTWQDFTIHTLAFIAYTDNDFTVVFIWSSCL